MSVSPNAQKTSPGSTAWQDIITFLHQVLLTSPKGEALIWPLPATQDIELNSMQLKWVHEMKDAFHGEPQRLIPELELACLALGFTSTDAQLIALAWLHQSERLGEFNPFLWPCELKDFEAAWSSLAPPPHTLWEPSPLSPDLGLYVVVPNANWVERLAHAGVPTVQLRMKSSDPQAIEQEIYACVKAVKGSNTQLFINDHWSLALEAGAHGVHLGQEDLLSLSAEAMGNIKGAGLHLGLSTHGYSEMMIAHHFKPSYMALGAVFPTTLKQMKTHPQGLGRLAQYARLMSNYSLVGIGGFDENTIPLAVSCGVGSVAVVRAITAAHDPIEQAHKLMKLFDAPRLH
jgi:thiamine-phosphate pyrophosphorylase